MCRWPANSICGVLEQSLPVNPLHKCKFVYSIQLSICLIIVLPQVTSCFRGYSSKPQIHSSDCDCVCLDISSRDVLHGQVALSSHLMEKIWHCWYLHTCNRQALKCQRIVVISMYLDPSIGNSSISYCSTHHNHWNQGCFSLMYHVFPVAQFCVFYIMVRITKFCATTSIKLHWAMLWEYSVYLWLGKRTCPYNLLPVLTKFSNFTCLIKMQLQLQRSRAV
jgi:hypothetical protein